MSRTYRDLKLLTLDQIQDVIRDIHGGCVELDTNTYVDLYTKARFTDVEHGEWWTKPYSVLVLGSGHPLNKADAVSQTHRLLIEEVRDRITQRHGDTLALDETTFTGRMCDEARFIDKTYGEWIVVTQQVVNGRCHPLRKHERKKKRRKLEKTTTVPHWKTSELCHCQSTYEHATVLWLNEYQYDFVWQPVFVTPFLSKLNRNLIYYVDLLILDGPFADTYVEIKGTWERVGGHIGKQKWEWFHNEHPNSQLWMKDDLLRLGILSV